jgi:PAS domain S-box-containing protein
MPEHITQSVLAEIVGIAADAIICIDEGQLITFFNSGAEAIFGWRSSEIIGQRIEVLIPEKFRKRHEEQVHTFGRSGVKARRMGERREISALRKNGEVFPAEAAISQVHQEGVRIYAVALRDVSVRHRFERRQSFLADAGERLAATVEMGDTLARIVALAVPELADGCIVETRVDLSYRTDATAHLDPAVAADLESLRNCPPRNPPQNHPLRKILRDPESLLITPGASAKLVELSVSPDYRRALNALGAAHALFIPMIARGQMIAVMELFRTSRPFDAEDVAFAEDFARLIALAMDNARLHDVLTRNLRSRDEMIGIVSHDLRNPVAAVKMLSRSILNRNDGAKSADTENIALMLQAADQMDTLIRDLLDVSRLDSGNLRLQTESIDPAILVRDSLRTLMPLAAEKMVELRNEIRDEMPLVRADIDRIQQVLSNLVGNALKFTGEGGVITVSAVAQEDEVRISVVDTGRGIASDQLQHVFERYWQSSRTDKHGAGLGLPIAKGIIEAHGGRIWIESELDVGTSALFTLPLATASGKPAA